MKNTDKMTIQEKNDIDIRFLLANERTLLAWVRTSIAIEAGGIALVTLKKTHTYFGVIVLLLGAVVALIGYHRYITAERAIRANKLPSPGAGPALQVIIVVLVAIIFSISELTFLH